MSNASARSHIIWELAITFHPAECPRTVRPFEMRRKGRPERAKKHAKLPKQNGKAEEGHIKNQITGTSNLKGTIFRRVHLVLPLLCCFLYHTLSALALIQGSDLQSMLSLQWDAALEQWASKVSPKLASPHLSMAFFMFQDAAFVCALAW